MRRTMTILALTGALVSPSGAGAEQVTASCSGTVLPGSTASCSSTFELSDRRFISILGTHAGYESLGGYGIMRLDWTDARGGLIAEFRCASIGVPAPVHATRLTCWRAGPFVDRYHAGTQTLTVTVENASCALEPCAFGGSIAVSADGDLI